MTYHHGNLRIALLDRAAEVIAESGIEALSLRALARDIGVSHAAPSRHFKDKADLLAALAAEGQRRMIDALNEAAEAAGDDPVARYNALGRECIRFSLMNRAYALAFENPEVQRHSDKALLEARAAYNRTVRQAAEAAQQAGWHPGVDVDVLQLFSTAAATGAASMLIHDEQYQGMPLEEAERLAAQIINLVIPPSSNALRSNRK
jgi:AcrR family transcriptional regulator